MRRFRPAALALALWNGVILAPLVAQTTRLPAPAGQPAPKPNPPHILKQPVVPHKPGTPPHRATAKRVIHNGMRQDKEANLLAPARIIAPAPRQADW